MPSDAELLKAYLAERDVACPTCGYCLKGCVQEKCPECGVGIVIGIRNASPDSGPFMLGLSGLLFGLGFYLPMLCLVLASPVASSRRGGAILPVEIGIVAGVSLLVVALILWLLFRRKITRARGPHAWVGCGALALLAAASPTVVLVMIR